MIITSPGRFYGGVTPDNIAKHEPRHRNKALAKMLMEFHLVDRAGMGVLRMSVNSLRYGRDFPRFTQQQDSVEVSMEAKSKSTSRSTAPANNRAQRTSDEPKANDAAANERKYWETIRLSTDVKDFKSYLEKYPDGQFAALARTSLRRLETAAKPADKTNSNSNSPYIIGSISGSNPGPAKPVPKPGSLVRNHIGMDLVYVPAGTFMMGSNTGEADEKPVHQVTIKEGFYMGRYEVTQAEWKQVMGNNPVTLRAKDCRLVWSLGMMRSVSSAS